MTLSLNERDVTLLRQNGYDVSLNGTAVRDGERNAVVRRGREVVEGKADLLKVLEVLHARNIRNPKSTTPCKPTVTTPVARALSQKELQAQQIIQTAEAEYQKIITELNLNSTEAIEKFDLTKASSKLVSLVTNDIVRNLPRASDSVVSIANDIKGFAGTITGIDNITRKETSGNFDNDVTVWYKSVQKGPGLASDLILLNRKLQKLKDKATAVLKPDAISMKLLERFIGALAKKTEQKETVHTGLDLISQQMRALKTMILIAADAAPTQEQFVLVIRDLTQSLLNFLACFSPKGQKLVIESINSMIDRIPGAVGFSSVAILASQEQLLAPIRDKFDDEMLKLRSNQILSADNLSKYFSILLSDIRTAMEATFGLDLSNFFAALEETPVKLQAALK